MRVCHHHLLSLVIVFTCLLLSFSRCLSFTVIFLIVTSEDVPVCCYIRNVKSIKSFLFLQHALFHHVRYCSLCFIFTSSFTDIELIIFKTRKTQS